MAPKSEALGLLEKADKKANSKGGWFSSDSTKWEEAGDLYQQAGNTFKIDRLFKEAGDAYAREAECRENGKEVNDAANAWWNAAKAYKQGYPDLAVAALGHTITHLTKGGRFRQAADREKEIGQIYLTTLNDLRKACESFERAGDWYAQEDAAATANGCYKDAADLHAELEEFPEAINRYEQVANHSLTSALTKYSVKEYWMRASLCALCLGQGQETVLVRRNMTRYATQDPGFPSTREAKFVTALADAVDAGDSEQYTAAVFDYDQMTKLDNWKTSMLLKIKKLIQEDGGLT